MCSQLVISKQLGNRVKRKFEPTKNVGCMWLSLIEKYMMALFLYERLSNRRYIKFEVLKMKIKSIFGNIINT